MFIYVVKMKGVCSCMACDCSKYVNSLWDCCHNTSSRNVEIPVWQEITKPKAVFMHKTCFLLFKPYLQLRETLFNNIYLHPWQKHSCLENWRMHSLPEGKKLLLPPLAYQRFRPHSFSQQQQALSNVTTPTGGEESLGTRLMLPIRLISKLSTKMWLQNLKTIMVVYSVYWAGQIGQSARIEAHLTGPLLHAHAVGNQNLDDCADSCLVLDSNRIYSVGEVQGFVLV